MDLLNSSTDFMRNEKKISYPLIILYSILAFPFVINGFYCNYIYILLPLLKGDDLFKNLKNYKLANPFNNIFLIYLLIYFLGLIYYCFYILTDPLSYNIIIKQAYSFLAFVSIFSLSSYSFNEKKFLAFKLSILSVTLFLSLQAIYILLTGGISSYFWAELKSDVGSMRNGLYYLLSICLLYFDDKCQIKISDFFSRFIKNKFASFLLYYLIYILLISGTLLTFSRTTYISGVFLIFIILLDLIRKFKGLRIRFISKNIISRSIYFLIFSLLLSFIYKKFFEFNLFEIIFTFVDQYIINLSSAFDRAQSINSSEGARLNILFDIIRNTLDSPIMGTSYLGYWFMLGEVHGSAHSQHLDILMKTGIVGFFSYIYLNFIIFKRIYLIDKSIYYGLYTALIFGIFSETFRYGGLSFVFAVTISICSNSSSLGINKTKN